MQHDMEPKDPQASVKPVDAPQPIKAADPDVPLHGIPDFHHVEEAGDHARMASMAMDKDVKGRVNTGTGEQPSNSGGSRFATHSGEEE